LSERQSAEARALSANPEPAPEPAPEAELPLVDGVVDAYGTHCDYAVKLGAKCNMTQLEVATIILGFDYGPPNHFTSASLMKDMCSLSCVDIITLEGSMTIIISGFYTSAEVEHSTSAALALEFGVNSTEVQSSVAEIPSGSGTWFVDFSVDVLSTHHLSATSQVTDLGADPSSLEAKLTSEFGDTTRVSSFQATTTEVAFTGLIIAVLTEAHLPFEVEVASKTSLATALLIDESVIVDVYATAAAIPLQNAPIASRAASGKCCCFGVLPRWP